MQPTNNRVYTQAEIDQLIRDTQKQRKLESKRKYKNEVLTMRGEIDHIKQQRAQEKEASAQEKLTMRTEIAAKEAMYDETTSHDKKQIMKNHIAVESVGTAGGIGTIILGACLIPVNPFVGVAFIIVGTIGTATGTGFLTKDAIKEAKIRGVMKERNISYAKANETLDAKK